MVPGAERHCLAASLDRRPGGDSAADRGSGILGTPMGAGAADSGCQTFHISGWRCPRPPSANTTQRRAEHPELIELTEPVAAQPRGEPVAADWRRSAPASKKTIPSIPASDRVIALH